ncbi:helix-turn-helix domain-containing protein [Mesorhizobium sp. B4-1-1]|nr:helix-turn-helix domain-containing protein [Mesorhizobium sp. B4-1-1]
MAHQSAGQVDAKRLGSAVAIVQVQPFQLTSPSTLSPSGVSFAVSAFLFSQPRGSPAKPVRRGASRSRQDRIRALRSPIAHIAELVGYRSLANFGRQFKALKGLTPREYRGRFAS